MKKQILSLFLCLCMLVGMLPLSVLAKTDDTISLDISEGSITIENGTNAYTFKVTQGSNTADNIDPLTIFEISVQPLQIQLQFRLIKYIMTHLFQ